MRIACLPVGDLQTPSTWYRIGQYLPIFKEQGIDVECILKGAFSLEALGEFDLVINQKNLFPSSQWKKFIRQKRVLFDFDDALWTRPIKPYNWLTQWRVNHRLKFWLHGAAHTTVAHRYLAHYAHQYTKTVSVIPMSLDLQVWKPGAREKGLIGWSGAPHNFHYLEKVQDDLLKLKSDFPSISFAIYSGKRPNLKIPFEYVPFKKGEEHLFTQRLDIGLLPLDRDPYSFGKSPIKALQYMACGVPIVSNLYDHAEQVSTSWYESLARLLASHDKKEVLSSSCRLLAEENHDLKKVAAKFITILRNYKGI